MFNCILINKFLINLIKTKVFINQKYFIYTLKSFTGHKDDAKIPISQ